MCGYYNEDDDASFFALLVNVRLGGVKCYVGLMNFFNAGGYSGWNIGHLLAVHLSREN